MYEQFSSVGVYFSKKSLYFLTNFKISSKNHKFPPQIVVLILCFCRVATFNDCEEAAKELQQQISEAREDLRGKGFNFEEKPDKKTD